MAKPTRVTNRITELRQSVGLSQAELADRIGVTRQTVNAIERGKYSPTLEAAFMITTCCSAPSRRSSLIPTGHDPCYNGAMQQHVSDCRVGRRRKHRGAIRTTR